MSHLRYAKIHESIGGIFGWVWMVTTVLSVVWLVMAILSNWSWWMVGLFFLISVVAKAAAREYFNEAQKELFQAKQGGEIE